jgi:hypothetical protein
VDLRRPVKARVPGERGLFGALALEAVGEAVSVCTKQDHRVTGGVVIKQGFMAITMLKDW